MTEKTTRYTIDMSADARDELSAWAGQYKLTQGEVIEVMLAFLRHSDQVAPAMIEKREAKVARRKAARETVAKLKSLPPEQLAALLETAGA